MNVANQCICADHDIAALLETIESFADAEIAARWQRPEIAIEPSDLMAIHAAAHQHGLLDASTEGYGLWAELARNEAPRLTLAALTCLARRNASAALYLHQLALAQAARACLGETAANATAVMFPASMDNAAELVLTGTQGWGRSALVRWLQEQPNNDDIHLLADNYSLPPANTPLNHEAPMHVPLLNASGSHNRKERKLRVAPLTGVALVPVFENQQFQLVCISLQTQPIDEPPAHGMDGLSVKNTGAVQWRAPLDQRTHAALITAHLLGMTAIALGLAQSAAHRANDYAALRVQGGRQIVKHDAVAMLISDMEGAMRATELQLLGACQTGAFPDCCTALAIKHECLPILCRAVNAAMQIHGGMGYMRDTGIENLLRDINCLRVMGGSPAELALMLASERNSAAAQQDQCSSADALPGFVHRAACWRRYRRFVGCHCCE